MTLAITLVIAAALALVVIFRVALSRGLQVSTDRSLAAQLQPIDVAAFRNLVDPAEDAYLRRRLPAAMFRRLAEMRPFWCAWDKTRWPPVMPALPTPPANWSKTHSSCVATQLSLCSESM
jgi:hypothetical protein